MALDVETFATVYPVLWHVTPRANAERIRRTKVLECAVSLMQAAGDDTWLRRKRPHDVPLPVDGETVILRDQQPLSEGHIAWEGGWAMPRLIEEINRRVFFWPGDRRAPTKKAKDNVNDFLASGDYVTLRIPFAAVLRIPRVRLEYCRFNSGAPRTVGGKRSPRGPQTFAAHGAWHGNVSDVREVSILERLPLEAIWDEVSLMEG
jgi:hypothetical protein